MTETAARPVGLAGWLAGVRAALRTDVAAAVRPVAVKCRISSCVCVCVCVCVYVDDIT